MIKNIKIKNFKSIKELNLDCSRINIFIGEPNTGKSNILESIGILSLPYTQNLYDFVRFENMSNLFYDNKQSEILTITYQMEIQNSSDSYSHSFNLGFSNGKYKGISEGTLVNLNFQFLFDYEGKGTLSITNDPITNDPSPIKFYKFKLFNNYKNQDSRFLLPPYGENLLQILLTNENLLNEVSDMFDNYGYRVLFRQAENKIEIAREERNKLITYPYSLVAETLQRMVFYLAAMETNKDSILIFEEPESFAFPFYTIQLAEKIARFNSNQFFISTHNPYFLSSIIEKTPVDEIKVFITSFSEYNTKVKELSNEELTKLADLGASAFFNLDMFLEVE